MKTMLLAAAAALSLGISSAYADSEGGQVANTQFTSIRGVLHYLWRAVDQHGVVLDILVQGRRNGVAAKRFFKHLLHGSQYKCPATPGVDPLTTRGTDPFVVSLFD